MQRITRWVALIASVSLLAGACASPSSPSPTQDPSSPSAPKTAGPGGGGERRLDGQPMTACLIKGELPVKAEIPGLCGTLTVPEDRSNPTGRRVALNVALVPALATTPTSDPVFAIAGGPGDASTQFFAWLPGLYVDVHATHDIVLVDQRGTGASNEMVLPAPPDISGLTPSESDALLSSWARDALASLGADPRFYTSTVAADDLDDVRLALGYDEIDLYGTSYGGTLAQYYLRQHGDHVRVAVLDGATPLDVPVMERIPANSEQALALLLARCASDPACGAALPAIADEWASLKAGLAAGIETSVTNPETGEKAVATLLNVGPSIHNALRTTAAAANLPLAIHLALEGKWDEATSLVPGVSAGGPSLLMAQEIFCSEAWARFDPDDAARLDADSYLLPSRLAEARVQAALCRHLPAGVVPADDASAVRTDVPVLWLTGDGDPQDPPTNLSDVASQQPNGAVVVMAAQEHVVGHLGCGPSLIAAFIEAGTAAGLDTSCVDQGPPLIPAFRLR